jgi:hypothetical protein
MPEPVEFTYRGRLFKGRPVTAEIRGHLDKRLVEMRSQRFVAMAEEILPRLQNVAGPKSDGLFRALLDKIGDQHVSEQERLDFVGSREGDAYILWLRVRDSEPDFAKLEACEQWIIEKYREVPEPAEAK